jgi:phosphate transport system substrate-binding protein
MRLKFLMVGLTAAVLAACGAKEEAKPAAAGDAPKAAESKAGLNGAGSSFIAPLFTKWAAEFNKSTGVAINYQSVG